MRGLRLFCTYACLLALLGAAGCDEETGVEVASFSFSGTEAVSEDQLKSVLATSASSKLPWGTNRYFNREQFEADLKRIQAFYQDRGFPDARVASFDVHLSEDQTAVDIAIRIEEGQPIVVQEIALAGFEALPAERRDGLEERLPLQPGEPLDRALLQASREVALDALRDHGFPYASVRVAVEELEASAGARVVALRADPGTKAAYGPIEITGNSSVDDEVIRRQLTFRPGQVFRQSQLQESQRQLYRQELFQFVNIEPLRSEGEPAEIPTRVTVIEGKHRKVNFSVGYGSYEKARAEVDWRHVNFFGGARTAGVLGRYSALDRGVRLNLTQPYFFSPRYSIGLSGQSWHTDEPAYKLNTNGGRVTVTREFVGGGRRGFGSRAATTFGLTYGAEHEEYSISNEALQDLTFRDTLIALGLDPRTGFGEGTRSFVSFDGGRNTTDNILDAKRGYVAAVHVEQAGKWLGGTFDYVELTAEGRYYQAVGNVLVLAVQGRAGSIDAFGEQDKGVPFFKRYFLGGATNLRGWGRFDVAPLSGAGLPIGGAAFLNTSVEVRAPIWGDLGGVLFFDAGNVWADPWQFDLSDMRYDIGPGLRYNTPIGPIRVDLGYQLNPIEGLLVEGEPEKRRFRVHFSIGQAF